MRTDKLFHRPAKLLAVGSLLFAALVASQSAVAQATIVGSKHDLTSAGAGPIKTTDANTEICVFCHTPHGASNVAPLWNKVLPLTGAFTPRYTSTTMDGTNGVVGPNSLTCLSCHDGVSAMDTMINQPGSGGYNSAGARAGYTWLAGSGVLANGAMPARTATTNVATIGVDLSDDHPIGIPYCGGFTGAACNDADFNTAKLYRSTGGVAAVATLVPGVANDQWWVDTSGTVIGAYTAPGTLGTRQKSDLVLYQDAAFIPTVQCASCHEPHGSSATALTFLRIPNAGSALCVTCHKK